MIIIKCFLFLYILHVNHADWISEWMLPVQDQFEGNPSQRTNNGDSFKVIEDEHQKMVPINQDFTEEQISRYNMMYRPNEELLTGSLKIKLERTLQSAKILAENLKAQIIAVTSRENTLKEAITNGRYGVSTVTVSTIGQIPRTYIVREGLWVLCSGIIHYPMAGQASAYVYNVMLSAPRCLGQEISTKPDPCVFNSVIKYETIPTQRRFEYTEDDYLCLKPAFNNTLERYMSVPKRLIDDTCKNGIVKSLSDNTMECGMRVMSEYTFYPNRSIATAILPLEYCTEKDGSCKLIMAWHVSNVSIENFEFLKDEQNFKKYFIKPGPSIEHVI